MSRYGFAAGDQCYKFTLDLLISNPLTSQSDVWLATDQTTSRRVALKIIDTAPTQLPQRLYEAQIGAKLRHANLCEVVGADVFSATIPSATGPVMVQFVAIGFEYQANGTCTKLLKGPGMMPIRDVHRLLMNVLAGLEYLHEAGWMHNDIKPANILVGTHGEFLLTDYGIAWAPLPGLPPANCYLPHVAPESVQVPGVFPPAHTPTLHTDIYQLGVTAYRLLNGVGIIRDTFNRLQASGQVQDFFTLVREGKIPDRSSYHPSVPHNLRRIVNKALSLNPNDRYVSALEMRRDLEKIAFPWQWEFTPTNEFQCVKDGAILSIEETPRNGKFEVCLFKRYIKSGKAVRPPGDRKTGLTRRQADAHRQKLMLEAIQT
jgi:serine/threonine protein kinase